VEHSFLSKMERESRLRPRVAADLGYLWLGIAIVAFFLVLGAAGNAFSSWYVLAIPWVFAGAILLSRLATWDDVDYLVDVIRRPCRLKMARAA
jgi:fatty acid desaturase